MIGLGLQNSLSQFKVITATLDRQNAVFEREPTVKRDIEHFLEKAPRISSVDDLMKDRRSLEFVLTAFQLEDQIDSKAFIRKIISQDLEDPAVLANRLRDTRYRALAEALQGLSQGQPIFANANKLAAVVQGYKTNQFEKFQGEKSDGLREAFYFRRQIGAIVNQSGTDDYTKILQMISSKPIARVVRVALGLPEEFSTLDGKTQARMLERRLDIKDLQDPKKLGKFIDRFLANLDLSANNSAASPYAELFAPASGGGGLGVRGILV